VPPVQPTHTGRVHVARRHSERPSNMSHDDLEWSNWNIPRPRSLTPVTAAQAPPYCWNPGGKHQFWGGKTSRVVSGLRPRSKPIFRGQPMRRRRSRTEAHGTSISLRPLGASSGHPEHRSVTPCEEDQRPDSLQRSLVAATRRRGMIPSRAWLLCRRASICTLLTLAGRVRCALLTHGLGSARSLSPARTVRARRREAYVRSVDAVANPPAIPVHSQRIRELASAKGGRSAATCVPRPLVARHDKRFSFRRREGPARGKKEEGSWL
jgi:hypothetical protein